MDKVKEDVKLDGVREEEGKEDRLRGWTWMIW